MKISTTTGSFWLATVLLTSGIASPAVAAASVAGPEHVTLGGIIHPDSDGTLAFAPDGKTVFFDRSEGKHKTIMVSHKLDGRWSKPDVAGFSGRWYDQDPVVSPDGSYIVFSSDRPIAPGGKPLVREVDGKRYHGGNLWKVKRNGGRCSAPTWLGATVNQGSFIVAPGVAADGTLYFVQRGGDRAMHIYRSRRRDGVYLAPKPLKLGDPIVSTHDPAIAPDQSFIVFGYGKTKDGSGRLSIAFSQGDHWSEPVDLGDAVNDVGPWGSHISADGRMVYFTGDSGASRLSLFPWLRAHLAQRRP